MFLMSFSRPSFQRAFTAALRSPRKFFCYNLNLTSGEKPNMFTEFWGFSEAKVYSKNPVPCLHSYEHLVQLTGCARVTHAGLHFKLSPSVVTNMPARGPSPSPLRLLCRRFNYSLIIGCVT